MFGIKISLIQLTTIWPAIFILNLIIFSLTAFILGIFTLVAINPLTSISVKYYEDIKGKYDVYKNHLASITDNGIWIREKIDNTTQIITNQLKFIL